MYIGFTANFAMVVLLISNIFEVKFKHYILDLTSANMGLKVSFCHLLAK